jgi:OOP family OmpA-OmpF porin
MVYHEDLKVNLMGYTDSSGDDGFNQKLSEQRAQSVKQAIVDRHGVDPSRIKAIGKGEENPVADNTTAEGRAKNRRVIANLEY